MKALVTPAKHLVQDTLEYGRRFVDRVWSKIRPPSLVLTYHRVCDPTFDPHKICVRPENFRKHLEIIRSLGLASRWSDFGDHTRPRVYVTFDDGYADNLETAAPLLEEAGVEGLFFIASQGAGRAKLFWWDELALRILHPEVTRPSQLQIGPGGRLPLLDLESPFARNAANQILHRYLKRECSVAERDVALEQLRAQTGEIPVRLLDSHRVMTAAEVRELAEHPMCIVGAHTRNHPCLRALDEGEQQIEIRDSRTELEASLDRKVELFSYPFGSYLDFDRKSKAIADQTGFRYAFANIPGTVKPGFDRLAIPRFTVRDWNERQFREKFADLLPELSR